MRFIAKHNVIQYYNNESKHYHHHQHSTEITQLNSQSLPLPTDETLTLHTPTNCNAADGADVLKTKDSTRAGVW